MYPSLDLTDLTSISNEIKKHFLQFLSDFEASRSPPAFSGSWASSMSGSPSASHGDPFTRGEAPYESSDRRFQVLFTIAAENLPVKFLSKDLCSKLYTNLGTHKIKMVDKIGQLMIYQSKISYVCINP
jgi:hypothetical protein